MIGKPARQASGWVRAMRNGRAVLAAVFMVSAVGTAHAAWDEKVLFVFDYADGSVPTGTLTLDAEGNLYGTTQYGGAAEGGIVFRLSPPGKGHTVWQETVLHHFTGPDGYQPVGNMILDAAGNLFGTTLGGGSAGCGTVFELSPPGPEHTVWQEKVLHAFTGVPADGCGPLAGLVRDAAGDLFGTTVIGDISGVGTVFELSPPVTGHTIWQEKVLNFFTGGHAGGSPAGGVIFDSSGILYGTAADGKHGYGVVYKLSPSKSSQTVWQETVLYYFTGGADSGPLAGLVMDAAGNLYGTTIGTNRGIYVPSGEVFRLSPPAAGQTGWTQTVLATFSATGAGEPYGAAPLAGLALDASGNLYGANSLGGADNQGTIFELSPPAKDVGAWTETLLHSFTGGHDGGSGSYNGGFPEAGVTLAPGGVLYGATIGGQTNRGTVFRLSPP